MYIFQRLVLRSCYIYILYCISICSQRSCVVERTFTFWWLNFIEFLKRIMVTDRPVAEMQLPNKTAEFQPSSNGSLAI